MGWNNWFKKKICLKRGKEAKTKQVESAPKKSNACNLKDHSAGVSTKNKQPTEDVAARQIQKAFRAYIVEWCGGSETMEEILNRIQQREEAAARRERAMAYAFSHQWRANSSQYLGQTYYDLSKDNCGWSWKERWIAVRPWEKRVEVSPTMPKKVGSKQKTSKTTNLAKTNIVVSVKPHLSNGKDPTHARKNSSQTIMKQASPDANLE